MGDSILNQAADRRGPILRTTSVGTWTPHIICIAGSGSSQANDLSGASFFNSNRFLDGYVTISVEGGASFWWYWSDATGTVDKTATGNGPTVGAFCPSGLLQDERPQGTWLVIQTSAAANIHIWISSGRF